MHVKVNLLQSVMRKASVADPVDYLPLFRRIHNIRF